MNVGCLPLQAQEVVKGKDKGEDKGVLAADRLYTELPTRSGPRREKRVVGIFRNRLACRSPYCAVSQTWLRQGRKRTRSEKEKNSAVRSAEKRRRRVATRPSPSHAFCVCFSVFQKKAVVGESETALLARHSVRWCSCFIVLRRDDDPQNASMHAQTTFNQNQGGHR